MIEKGIPISPSQVAEKKKEIMPEVIDIFNELIAKNFNEGRALIKTKEASELICERLMITKNEVYERHYLDVEEVYRKSGWKVIYSQPDWTESFDSYFEFKNDR